MKRFFQYPLLMLAMVATAVAQNSHGSLTGQVTDPAGASVTRAKVSVVNTDTGYTSNVLTTGRGYYTAPELPPGPYKLTVDATGFKSYVQTGITIETTQNVTQNIKLTVGETTDTVNVSSDAPMIDVADASTGQVLTNAEVEDLPNNGGSPLGFARIEYGAVSKAKHDLAQALPFNNSTVDDFSLGGGNSASNELLLNGVSNMQDGSRTAGFSPGIDSVDEIRVDVFGANASYGDTSGGTVNITTKGGTNKLHGSAYWFYEGAGCSSQTGTVFYSRADQNCSRLAALPYATKVGSANSNPPATHNNHIGFTIGGPVWIPKVWDGRNKLFFFYAYDVNVGQQPPAQTLGSVPTAAERNGDFSALLQIGCPAACPTGINPNYQLYNPYTAAGTTTSYTRTAIPGNVLSNAGLSVSPIAQAYFKLVPLPNYTGSTTTPDGQNNYFTFTPLLSNYRSHEARIDYNINAKNKIWGEAHRSRYLSSASNYFHDSLTGTISDGILSGGLIEDVETFNPSTFLDIRGSVTRYDNSGFVSSSGISPTSVGFAGYLAGNSTSLALPQITFSESANSPLAYSNVPTGIENFDTIQLNITLTKIVGKHSISAGTDIRAYKNSTVNPGAANGTFAFAAGKTSPVSSGTNGSQATYGSSIALFDIGIPTSGSYNIVPKFQYDSFLDGFFLQDNWKLRPNITIASGIRLEHETPTVESQNRMVNGFNPSTVNEATAPSEANYALAPGAYLPASSFVTTGGVTYASAGNRSPYYLAPVYVSPRIGMTWAPEVLKGKGVLRLGYGVYTNPFGDYNTGQSYGYSAATSYVESNNSGFTVAGSLADPFPIGSNPLLHPTGNALGFNTNLGAGVVYYPHNVKVPYSERTSVDIQYQYSKNGFIDIGYVNNHQVHLSYANAINTVPLLPYLSRSPYYSQATVDLLSGSTVLGGKTTNITNPFKGVTGVTGGLSTGATLAPSTYLLSNPEYSGVTEQLVPGSGSNYNALNARINERVFHGFTVNGVFEWSRLLGTFNQLNSGDILNYGETTSDYPFHFSGYGTYLLPFGKGRDFFNHTRFLDPVIGGWQMSAIYQFLSGMPIQWGNAIYTGSGWGDFHNVQHSSANRLGQKVFNTSVFDTRIVVNSALAAQNNPAAANYNPDIQPNGDNYRTFPQYLLRQDYTSNWDGNVQKNTLLGEGVTLQLRLDVFNVLNRPQYNTPNVSPTSSTFGTTGGVVYSGTLSRTTQLAAHFIF